jgi:hypothetical protein
MNEVYPLSLALFDFVPIILFLTGAYFYARLCLRTCGPTCGWLAASGAGLVGLGGLLQASWKLLYAAGVGYFPWLGDFQFPLGAPGFLALFLAALMLARRPHALAGAGAATMAVWKIPLLVVMTFSGLGLHSALAYTAWRSGQKLAAAAFLLAFTCLLGMGGMASGEQTVARQWLEEGVNSLGQLGFMAGSLLLERSQPGGVRR